MATQAQVAINPDALAALKLGFRGEITEPGDPGYDLARQLWNGMFDKRPALVAMCAGTADVIDAVRFAREHHLEVAVRGGAHAVAGTGSVEGGLMINLSRMNDVHIDVAARRARVGGGATWGDVDREAQAFALVTPGGVVSDTGVAGLSLGGGIGWVRNKYGLSCDNIVSAEVVTADGTLVTASESEHADLLWGLRGGGGNFGVVTSFEFALHPLGPEVAVAMVMYPFASATSVLRGWRDFVQAAPEEVSSAAFIWTVPADPAVMPEPVLGREVAITAAAYAGPVADGERVLQPLRELGTPLLDLSGPWPFRTLQSALDPYFGTKGFMQSYWTSTYLDAMTDEAIDTIVRLAGHRPTPWALLNIPHFGGAVTRVAPDATAFGQRHPFMVSIDANSVDAGVTNEQLKSWARGFREQLLPFSPGGVYLNFLGEEERANAELVQAAFGANYERLRALKRKYDPDNFFRVNQNIQPG